MTFQCKDGSTGEPCDRCLEAGECLFKRRSRLRTVLWILRHRPSAFFTPPVHEGPDVDGFIDDVLGAGR